VSSNPPEESPENKAEDEVAGSVTSSDAATSGGEVVPNEIPEVEAEEIGRVLEMVPPQSRGQLVAVLSKVTAHRGPLPPPGMLAEYDQVLPGLAERIVRLPEKEQEHRHAMVDRALGREIKLKERGQLLGFVSLILLLLFAAYLVYAGDTKAAAAVASVTIVGVVGVFVTGRYLESKDSKAPVLEEEKSE